MLNEKEWVNSLQPRLDACLRIADDGEWTSRVESGTKSAYANEIIRYGKDNPEQRHIARYETDLLVIDTRTDGDWIPRVVIECKSSSVTTHDALTYSTKAATHKHVHPYLRYGVLVGGFGKSVPGRLIRHGAYFDFMLVWESQEATNQQWAKLVEILADEVRASRTMHALLSDSRSASRLRYGTIHRPLRVY